MDITIGDITVWVQPVMVVLVTVAIVVGQCVKALYRQ